ncbi:MAG: hypothetical protein CVT89_01845 [Candidatus Altiarchaeales archaeon HGW-Altiarchaeales-2]|nr:MAG: hypothetical protein CVT89_01845 [Candidatus Altiarchaeales archaeon HGW-Altiarchaeales-2]
MEIWEGNPNMEAFHQMEEELLEKHHGKVAVFCNGKLAAIGEDIVKAIEKAKKVYKGKTFFVRELFTAEEQSEAIL